MVEATDMAAKAAEYVLGPDVGTLVVLTVMVQGRPPVVRLSGSPGEDGWEPTPDEVAGGLAQAFSALAMSLGLDVDIAIVPTDEPPADPELN